jgi:ribonuclease D
VKLPPHIFITSDHQWQACLNQLRAASRLAIDLEANSMYAYREQVCLIQISIATQDYIVDPLARLDLSPLGTIISDPAVEKVFHAAEYDLMLLKRQYDWELNNLFDTMWAARILGYQRYGLASLLGQLYDVKLNKRLQKSNWCKRPLTEEQRTYAQLDTHYLLRLRDLLEAEIKAAGQETEAAEIFLEQTRVKLSNNAFDPDGFWTVSGAFDLPREQQAILKELHIFRDSEAKRRDQPLFKIFTDKTMIELAELAPTTMAQLRSIHGMTAGQIRRYGERLLHIIEQGRLAPAPPFPKRSPRLPDSVVNRYEKLHNWRKLRAQARGVESDVIISRDALWHIAQQNPRTTAQLSQLDGVGQWRCHTYGAEIVNLLHKSGE